MKLDCTILAAGEGSRMFPISAILEKSLLPINGKPCIRHIVDKLKLCKSVGEIHIHCLKKFENQFMHEFRDVEEVGILSFDKPIGTYNTWYLGAEGSTEYCMVHYADCITNIDYNDFISGFFKRCDFDKYDGIIAVTDAVRHDYSLVEVYPATLRVEAFYEKPHIGGYTWSGIGLFNTERLENYYDGNPSDSRDFAFDIFPQMIKQEKLIAYPYHGQWMDVGNLNSYMKMCKAYEEGKGLSSL